MHRKRASASCSARTDTQRRYWAARQHFDQGRVCSIVDAFELQQDALGVLLQLLHAVHCGAHLFDVPFMPLTRGAEITREPCTLLALSIEHGHQLLLLIEGLG